MKLHSNSLVGILSLCLAHLVVAAPANETKALIACAKKALKGNNTDYRLVTPQSETYAAASKGDMLFDQNPAIITYATSIDEITALVQCGNKYGFNITPRSGGHHFENWSALSGTLVIDVSHFNYVRPSPDGSTATFAAGAKLAQVYEILGQTGRTINGGICPTVGMGGYLGAGGYNMQQRLYGMAVDYVNSITLVLADGRLVTASKTENPDLFWAARGGGMYGFIVEITFQTMTIPRSAMIWANFSETTTRNEAVQKYNDWAADQDPAFNSQLNLYSSYAGILGWYVGKTAAGLQAIFNTSGLQDIKGASIKITDNCSTKNSRNFWLYTQTECTDDATADKFFDTWFNVVPDDFGPVPGTVQQFAFDHTPVLPDKPKATAWPRVKLINKTYFITKSKPIQKEDIKYITDTSGALPEALGFWVEYTAFNISTPATSAFAWQSEAEYLLRFEVLRVDDPELQAQGRKFMDDLDAYLIPRIGTASYSGYTDANISANPYTAYWGDNVCSLSQVKAQYDPNNLFSNPFSIPPTNPLGVTC